MKKSFIIVLAGLLATTAFAQHVGPISPPLQPDATEQRAQAEANGAFLGLQHYVEAVVKLQQVYEELRAENTRLKAEAAAKTQEPPK